MKPAPFRYHAPKTIEEAVATLAEVAGEDGRVLAGGQSLVPIMAFRLARPAHLVDINGVTALARLAVEDGKLCIGACVRHAAFHKPVVDGPLGRLLSDGRAPHRALSHSHPRHVLRQHRARRSGLGMVPGGGGARRRDGGAASAAARAPSRRGLFPRHHDARRSQEDELLIEVRLPILPADTRFGFYEFNRRAGDFALGMALATYRVEDGVIVEPRVALGGVEAQPRRIARGRAGARGTGAEPRRLSRPPRRPP